MTEAIGICGIITGVFGLVFGFVTLFRNKKTDDKSEGEREGQIYTELGYIKKGIDGIERRFEAIEKKYTEVLVSVAKMDESLKSAHKRISALEEYHKPN